MVSDPERARDVREIAGRRRDREASLAQLVIHAAGQLERPAGLRRQLVGGGGEVGSRIVNVPPCPAHEAVYRRVALDLVDRKLVVVAFEAVAAVRYPVGPRDQHLAPARRADLRVGVSVEHWDAGDVVGAQPAADLDDGRPVRAVPQENLTPRGDWHRASARRPRSAGPSVPAGRPGGAQARTPSLPGPLSERGAGQSR